MNIGSSRHLHCDIKDLVKCIVREMISANKRLKKRVVYDFVNSIICSSYFATTKNSYHKVQHTFEVFQMTTYLMNKKRFTREQRTMLQVAALCHDYGHHGISNAQWEDYEIADQIQRINSTDSALSDILFSNERSISGKSNVSHNEIMHIDKTLAFVVQYKEIFFPTEPMHRVKQMISELILATDLSEHDFYLEQKSDPFSDMILILKLADISHSMRPFKVHLYWVYGLRNETKQNDTPCVRYMAEDTIGFIKRFVKPLLNRMALIADVSELSAQLDHNIRTWISHI